jgi:hypothetical protein
MAHARTTHSAEHALSSGRPRLPFFGCLARCSLAAFLGLAACGTPGDPTPPRVPVPEAITNLAAQQQGDKVVLNFSLPAKSTDGESLTDLPELEILRRSDPSSPPAPLYTVPAALVETYLRDGRVYFEDPIPPAVMRAAEEAVNRTPAQFPRLDYIVRTRLSRRRSSADSNLASVEVFPVPQPIRDLAATVTASAIELRWTPPERTLSGAPLVSLAGYRIYRAEDDAGKGPSAPAPSQLLAVSPAAHYLDARFEFGRTYRYWVRSVAQFGASSIESPDSNLVVVEARDVFPPAPPLNLVAVPVPAAGDVPAHIELSWGIHPESDVAGYNVYRTEAGAPAESRVRLNPALLPTPAFRDMTAAVGRSYVYSVTAVDRAGNESAPSAPAASSLPSSSARE